jgi:hypothetical protein
MGASIEGSWINLRDFSKEFIALLKDEVERYMSPLRDTATKFFNLLRWRSGIEDGLTAYAARELISEDGENWFEVGFGHS